MEKNKTNRKQRKALWINAKNLMRKYPDCAYNGDFYCNHIYDPRSPWCWVDFRFFHTKLKKYFAVALTTLEYKEWNKDEDKARDKAIEKYPYEEEFFYSGFSNVNVWMNSKPSVIDTIRQDLEQTLTMQFNKEVRLSKPEIKIKDYGPVVVGVWATVNKPFIDENVIREFIEHFRSLGEPIIPGYSWYGDETEVLPQKLRDRYTASVIKS